MSPSVRDIAHIVGTAALAPFVEPVFPDGPDGDRDLRDSVSQIARGGDKRPLPIVAGALGFSAARAALTRVPDVELEELDDTPALDTGWTPDALTAGEGAW